MFQTLANDYLAQTGVAIYHIALPASRPDRRSRYADTGQCGDWGCYSGETLAWVAHEFRAAMAAHSMRTSHWPLPRDPITGAGAVLKGLALGARCREQATANGSHAPAADCSWAPG